MTCPGCGQPVAPEASFCPHCGSNLNAAADPVSVPRAQSYSPIPDLIGILAGTLVVVSIFLPWIGTGDTSPLALMRTGMIVWWMWVIPLALALGSLLGIVSTLIRILAGKPKRSSGWWSYFAYAIGLAAIAMLWWLMLVNLPVFPTPQGYVTLPHRLLAGTSVGVGLGFYFLFAAAGLQVLAGFINITGRPTGG